MPGTSTEPQKFLLLPIRWNNKEVLVNAITGADQNVDFFDMPLKN